MTVSTHLYQHIHTADVSDSVVMGAALELTEEDISGAALAEPLEFHTVPVLKWWLLCCGIKVPSSWKKQ